MADLPDILVWHAQGDAYASALAKRLPGARVTVINATDHDTGAGRGAYAGSDAQVLLAWKVPPGVLRRMPRLRWVQVSGAGVDHFLQRDDLPDDVLLTRSLGRFGIQVAEYVVGYLLHHLLAIERYRERQRERRWEREERPLLSDRTVGIVGLGSLGLPLARLLTAIGATVLGVRRSGNRLDGVEQVFSARDWRSMLPRCDALVLAAPRTAETAGMIDADALAALPRGALLINVARGELIDDDALLQALDDGHLGGAVLDVFTVEPLPTDHPFWSHPRVVLTPHIAAPSEVDVIADEFAENYRRFTSRRELINRVERARGY